MDSYFTNTEFKKEIIDLYFKKLNQLGTDYEFLTVETSFGDTNIITTGNKYKHPLVLVHGSNSCAPIAIETFIELKNHFNIYAIDILGQPNLSVEVRLNMKSDEYGKWMYEILSRLSIQNVFLVGVSFGGFISLKSIVYDSSRITKVFLIVPAGIVNGNFLKKITKVLLPIKMYKWQKNEKYLKQFLNNIFTHKDLFALEFLSKVLLNFKMDFSPIPLINKKEAKSITVPLYVVAMENDILFPGNKLIKRSKVIFPSLKEILLLKNFKHIPGKEGISKIIKLIIESSNK